MAESNIQTSTEGSGEGVPEVIEGKVELEKAVPMATANTVPNQMLLPQQFICFILLFFN